MNLETTFQRVADAVDAAVQQNRYSVRTALTELILGLDPVDPIFSARPLPQIDHDDPEQAARALMLLIFTRDVIRHVPSNASILEVGCGDGDLSALLADAFPHGQVVGVDASPGLIERASKRTSSRTNLQFDTVQMNNGYDLSPYGGVVGNLVCFNFVDPVLEKAVAGKVKTVMLVPCCADTHITPTYTQETPRPLVSQAGQARYDNEQLKTVYKAMKEHWPKKKSSLKHAFFVFDRALFLAEQGYQTTIKSMMGVNGQDRNLMILGTKYEQTIRPPDPRFVMGVDPTLSPIRGDRR